MTKFFQTKGYLAIKLLSHSCHFLHVTKEQRGHFTPVSRSLTERAEMRGVEWARERSCKETQYPLERRVIRIGGWTNRRKEMWEKNGRRCDHARLARSRSLHSGSTFLAQLSLC